MKLYEAPSPNARRVHIALAEKGIEVARESAEVLRLHEKIKLVMHLLRKLVHCLTHPQRTQPWKAIEEDGGPA